ncbi:cell cycle checkpoint control protein RAD9A [Episyrphus balteatus]|uniref:cell cycle checkpoint control protein RAD9A n=1 Tax=Episyrphus balteatus TaxID=286459 RepID=UPI00248669F3|nr:cell cycle checkpoint control protein RAD9A [Episyrphus balteatus]
MKCVLSGANSRIFAKAIQSLSKFGTDLYIEADDNGFQLRSVNANKSAVGTFKFFTRFFETYDLAAGSSDDENYCRLSMKACLGAFKSMKQVETCSIQIQPSRSKFLVQMNCKHETVKHFIISIIDDDNVTAEVPMDNFPNSIGGSYKIFQEIVGNFQTAEEEITFEVRSDKVNVKNYVEGSRVNDKFMRSQLKLTSDEFENYTISEETQVTFCLKEFRAFLLFSEALFENLEIKFREAGSPIVFQIEKANFFEGVLIMSTLSPDEVTMCEDVAPREITESFLSKTNAQKSATKRKPPPKKVPPARESKRLNSSSLAHTTTMAHTSIQEELPSSDDSSIFRFDRQSVDVPRNHRSTASSTEIPRIPSLSQHSEMIDTNLGHSQPMEINDNRQSESEVFVTFVETEENQAQGEQIAQSPEHNDPNKKGLRYIFSRCFEATYVPREPSPTDSVYVPDSDEEK